MRPRKPPPIRDGFLTIRTHEDDYRFWRSCTAPVVVTPAHVQVPSWLWVCSNISSEARLTRKEVKRLCAAFRHSRAHCAEFEAAYKLGGVKAVVALVAETT